MTLSDLLKTQIGKRVSVGNEIVDFGGGGATLRAVGDDCIVIVYDDDRNEVYPFSCLKLYQRLDLSKQMFF